MLPNWVRSQNARLIFSCSAMWTLPLWALLEIWIYAFQTCSNSTSRHNVRLAGTLIMSQHLLPVFSLHFHLLFLQFFFLGRRASSLRGSQFIPPPDFFLICPKSSLNEPLPKALSLYPPHSSALVLGTPIDAMLGVNHALPLMFRGSGRDVEAWMQWDWMLVWNHS